MSETAPSQSPKNVPFSLVIASYERAGEHYKRITTPERRLDSSQVVERLQGMSRDETDGTNVPTSPPSDLRRVWTEWLRTTMSGV